MTDFIARMKIAIDHINQARDIFAKGPLDFYLKTLIEHSDALLTKFAPLRVGNKAVITGAVKCDGGWKGCESTLRIGATGTVSDVQYSENQFWFSFVPDVEFFRDENGVERVSTSSHSYLLSESKLTAVFES